MRNFTTAEKQKAYVACLRNLQIGDLVRCRYLSRLCDGDVFVVAIENGNREYTHSRGTPWIVLGTRKRMFGVDLPLTSLNPYSQKLVANTRASFQEQGFIRYATLCDDFLITHVIKSNPIKLRCTILDIHQGK